MCEGEHQTELANTKHKRLVSKPKKGQGNMLQIELLPAASAATRLLVSQANKYAVAELHGSWVAEAFPGHEEEIPPVLKMIDLGTGKVIGNAYGWALGAPGDDGDLLFIEEFDEEYKYRVRSHKRPELIAELKPPDGFWLPKAALRTSAPDRAIVVLWSAIAGVEWRLPEERQERLWIAVIARETLNVEATMTLDTATPNLGTERFSIGVAANPIHSQIYIVELPKPHGAPDWHILALDANSLKIQWRTSLLPATTLAETNSLKNSNKPTSGKLGRPPIPSVPQSPTPATASEERLSKNALIGVSGDGAYVAVVYGHHEKVGVDFDTMFILDASDGSLVRSLSGSDMKLAWYIHQIASIPGTSSIALLHLLHFRQGLGESYETVFHGVSTLDLAKGAQIGVYEVSKVVLGDDYDKINKLNPVALAARVDGLPLLAPQSFYWVRKYGGDENWPEGDGQGVEQPEVRGLVKTPLGWHTPGRRRVEERNRFLGID